MKMKDGESALDLETAVSGLGSDSMQDRIEAVQELYQIGEDAVPALCLALKDQDAAVRLAAVESLRGLGNKRLKARPALEFLTEVLDDPEFTIRQSAIFALSFIGTEAIPAIVKALDDSNVDVGLAACAGIGRLGALAKSAVPALTKALHHETPEIRAGAEWALRRIIGGSGGGYAVGPRR